MARFAQFVLHHRRWVTLGWLLVFLVGGASAGQLSERLSLDFSLPGQPGDQAEQQLIARYGVSSDSIVPVITVPDGQTVADRKADVAAVYEAVRTELPNLRVVDYASSGDAAFLTADGRSTFGLVYAPRPAGFGPGIETKITPVIEKAASAKGLKVGLTSYALLAAGGDTSTGPSILTETLLGALGALAVLTFVFASFLALVPLLIAVVSILTTFLIVLGLTTFTDVSFVVQFLISLVGLGVAIDYSLLVVSRWREERAHGVDNNQAVITAMTTAGNAVLASGVTVAISLIALVVVPVPLLRSMGIGGVLIPLTSIAVVLTLLPALLSTIGPRVDWPRLRKEGVASKGWSAWARLVVRRRYVAAAVGVGLLALAISPVFGIAIGASTSGSLATNGAPYDAMKVLRDGGIGTGVLTPIVVQVPQDQAESAAKAAAGVDGVLLASVGEPRSGHTVIDVIPKNETVDSNGTAVVDRTTSAVKAAVPGKVEVSGAGAVVEDYFNAVYKNFPLVLALIAAVTFILLVRTFRSLLLPLKAVLLNLVSVAAVFGVTVFFWQEGNGSEAVFGIAGTGAITFWLPVLIFAFLFGLSMDYEVFILARMREEYDKTGSTTTAVVEGLGRTGRLVTSAALILFFAFIALASAPGTDIKVFATALGVGILLDATVVRALLVPALVSLFGRWNWWLPAGVARVLRVEPSPLPPLASDAR
jgi:putative drug exporter of the RND superfamily